MTPTSDADRAALEPFFAAARADHPAPREALVSAILGDAAETSFARRGAALATPRRPWPLRRIVEPIGGWGAVAALAACALAGFWLGLAGEVSIDGTTVWAGTAAASDASSDQVGAFFDLASTGG